MQVYPVLEAGTASLSPLERAQGVETESELGLPTQLPTGDTSVTEETQ